MKNCFMYALSILTIATSICAQQPTMREQAMGTLRSAPQFAQKQWQALQAKAQQFAQDPKQTAKDQFNRSITRLQTCVTQGCSLAEASKLARDVAIAATIAVLAYKGAKGGGILARRALEKRELPMIGKTYVTYFADGKVDTEYLVKNVKWNSEQNTHYITYKIPEHYRDISVPLQLWKSWNPKLSDE